MKNFALEGFEPLTIEETKELNGGVVCGGLCIAVIAGAILLASTTEAY